MIQENLLIVTTHPEFLDAGLAELRQFDKRLASVELLAPGIALCTTADVPTLMRLAAEQHPIFVRHIAPVQAIVPLSDTEQDVGKLALAVATLPTFERLERGQRFAVQTRISPVPPPPPLRRGEVHPRPVQPPPLRRGEVHPRPVPHRPLSSGQLNKALAEAIIEETAAVESIKKPQIVVSLLCTASKGYLGISLARENLSDWPGGARHFAHTPEQISRAEFKLLEALEVFGVTLPTNGRVLDLGAAPGGWTRVLLEAGLHVIAVDPANLDPRLAKHPRLEHYCGYAENYLEHAIKTRQSFAAIVNDMRMDARDAARLLGQASRCLSGDGFVISALKLPHATREIDPLATLRAALKLLDKHYGIVEARQLFHNRQEVTVLTAKPLLSRA